VADELWASFTTAGFTCWCPEPVTVRPVPGGRTSGPFPVAGPATFVTTDNPGGRAVADEENLARRSQLTAFLTDAGLVWYPAVGGAPGGNHLEPGALVLGLDVASAAALGARFGQAAVYLWTPAGLHLIACAGDRHEILGYQATPAARPIPLTGEPGGAVAEVTPGQTGAGTGP